MTTFVNSAPVVLTTPAVSSLGNMAYSKAFRVLGIFQILLGTLSIITWSYSLVFTLSEYYYDVFVYISAGIWCGIFFLVAGILATVSSVEPNNCKIVSGMVMSIFAAIFAATMFGIEVTGALSQNWTYNYGYYGYYSSCTPYYQSSYYQSSTYVPTCYSPYSSSQYISGVYIPSKYISCYNYYSGYNYGSNGRVGMTTLHGFMAFFAFAELIVAITHSVFCCKYKSLTSTGPAPTVQYTTTYQQPITHQMPVTSIGHPGGMPIAATYPGLGTTPYQFQSPPPVYANQATMHQPPTSNFAVTSPPVVSSSPAMTSPPAIALDEISPSPEISPENDMPK